MSKLCLAGYFYPILLRLRFKLISDFTLNGLSGKEMKMLTESTSQNRVTIKGSSVQIGSKYAPVLCSTNLSSKEVFMAKHRETRGETRSNFDLEDWVKNFSDGEGRYTNVYFRSRVPACFRWAPQGKHGAVHRNCLCCGAGLWKWLAGHHVYPRGYGANDVHRNSDDETCSDCPTDPDDDDRVIERPKIGSIKSRDEAVKFLTQGARYKKWRGTRAAKRKQQQQRENEVPKEWIKLTKGEKAHLADIRSKALGNKSDGSSGES